MYRTIEAIYDEGKIITDEPVNIKKAKVLITILEDKSEEDKGMKARELIKYRGILKNFEEDPVLYQRRLRDEW
ncbi:MAG TPA: hypothetical protein PL110_20085 [Candidatus Eremiobacteraeota bacterium]|nr:MAG: hypothetical protein BWY64_03008 [bacterium ADurb.Bin363]HPZ10400.1 hypothetical protein [Candidatus Eremiobacteraeota bacterium]